MVEPIASVAQITPAWLTQWLQEGGHLDQGRVVSVELLGQLLDQSRVERVKLPVGGAT